MEMSLSTSTTLEITNAVEDGIIDEQRRVVAKDDRLASIGIEKWDSNLLNEAISWTGAKPRLSRGDGRHRGTAQQTDLATPDILARVADALDALVNDVHIPL